MITLPLKNNRMRDLCKYVAVKSYQTWDIQFIYPKAMLRIQPILADLDLIFT
jgi:hypothetical protein